MKFVTTRTLVAIALILTLAGCTGDRLRQSAAPSFTLTVIQNGPTRDGLPDDTRRA
jgi:hypothetical protein